MKEKIIGILVSMLLIATAVPALGTTPNLKVGDEKSVYSSHEIEVEWDYIYGGPNIEVFRDVKQTNDGGYIAVGAWNATRTPTDSGAHWLVKVDSNGEEEWNATALPNSSFYPRCYNVEQTSDGGYITAGSHESGTWGYNRCVWKVDEDGKTEWLKIYDDPLNGYHMCIQETSDGGYIVAGEVDLTSLDWDVLLMKINSSGDIEWQKIHKFGEYGDNARAVRQTSDGGYILCGRSETGPGVYYSDLLVIKTDSSGDIEWDNTFGGEEIEFTQSSDILFAEDGGYYFLGETSSFGAGSRDIWLIKTDADGNMVWNKTFGGTKHDMCGGMDFTDDDGIIIAGTLNAFDLMSPHSSGLVIKTDLDGVLEWQHAFGDEGYDEFQSAYTTSDGDYIVAGDLDSTDTSGYGLVDSWLIKMKAFENNPPDKPDKPSGKKKITPGALYSYKTSTSDPEGDQLYYCWDWNDSDDPEIEWLGPYESGDVCEAEHYWDEDGNYTITVVAKDSYGRESEISDGLRVTTPKSKVYNFNFPILNWLLEKFPNAFPILRHIMG